MNTPRIYLDHNATTPISPRALAAMVQVYEREWGNAGAVENQRGQAAEALLAQSRTQIADAIGARADEIVFTSGATEANNLAILGTTKFRAEHEGKSRVVVIATEHKCVLEAAKNSGLTVDVCRVHPSGEVDLDHLSELLTNDVALLSCMLVNNETGVIQDISAIAALCRQHDIKLHCDAAQGLGKTAIDVGALGVDLLSLSAHKAHGPMGVGALYVRRRPRARLAPLLFGGGQERGLRSGTVPLPLAVGFGEAAAEVCELLDSETARLTPLQAHLEQELTSLFPDAIIKNTAQMRVSNSVNISLQGYDYHTLFQHVSSRFDLSSGSACSSADIEPSYVLKAMGLDDQTARSTLRIGMGRNTTRADIDALVAHMAEIA